VNGHENEVQVIEAIIFLPYPFIAGEIKKIIIII